LDIAHAALATAEYFGAIDEQAPTVKRRSGNGKGWCDRRPTDPEPAARQDYLSVQSSAKAAVGPYRPVHWQCGGKPTLIGSGG